MYLCTKYISSEYPSGNGKTVIVELTPVIKKLGEGPLLLNVVHLCQVCALQQTLLAGLLPGESSKHNNNQVNINMLTAQ